jgi:hypothetical protein
MPRLYVEGLGSALKIEKGPFNRTKEPRLAPRPQKLAMSFCPAGGCSPTTAGQNLLMSSKDIMRSPRKIEKSTLVTWKQYLHDRSEREGENGTYRGLARMNADSRIYP